MTEVGELHVSQVRTGPGALGGPGPSAVRGGADDPARADDPTVLSADERDAVKVAVVRHVGVPGLPGAAAIGGDEQEIVHSDRPAVAIVGERGRVQAVGPCGVLGAPAGAAVGGHPDHRSVDSSHRPAVQVVGERNARQVIRTLAGPLHVPAAGSRAGSGPAGSRGTAPGQADDNRHGKQPPNATHPAILSHGYDRAFAEPQQGSPAKRPRFRCLQNLALKPRSLHMHAEGSRARPRGPAIGDGRAYRSLSSALAALARCPREPLVVGEQRALVLVCGGEHEGIREA